jgi:hypothetical protein
MPATVEAVMLATMPAERYGRQAFERAGEDSVVVAAGPIIYRRRFPRLGS